MRTLSTTDRERIDGVIADHVQELRALPGFLSARAGFPIRNGGLVREPGIIVYVRDKTGGGFRTDGAAGTFHDLPVEFAVPDPDTQIDLMVGMEGAFMGEAFAEPTYEGLPGDPIDAEFTIREPLFCHVGPDSGWVVLRDFIAGARKSLTCAIYDFNAPYIATTMMETAAEHGFEIRLAIDDHIVNAEGTVQELLEEKLADLYDAEIIFCRAGARFPSAYHEKVVVRDGRAFWLSSGNWTRSSQPEIDPVGDPGSAAGMYGKGNREWHVIVEDEELAQLFARYIEHDREQAQGDTAAFVAPSPSLPDLLVPLADIYDETVEAALIVPQPVRPERLPSSGKPFTVRPLLSPDNYARRVRELIESAERSLYMQYSYINWTDKEFDAGFRAMLEYLAELSWNEDFDLRVLVNSRDAAEKVRLLAENGFNDKVFRGQARIHNKGIVIDSERVLISSQNWSGDGFLRNRDAGLIVHDREVAAYYERIFIEDWERRGRSPFAQKPAALVALEGEPTPPGMVRMSWSDYHTA
jgi:phosphatidylserine/phosphatidylglycerophosphate/cardiolipin synthase-like enzyme